MFGWFRKYIRKIGIFGVEVEFHPPTDTVNVPSTTATKPNKRSSRSVREVLAADGLPDKQTGRYIMFLDEPYVAGAPAPRYVHFSYKRDRGEIAFCIRDYLGKAEWRQGEAAFTAPDYWKAAKDIITCSREEGLFVPVEDAEFWQNELQKRTHHA